MLRKISILFLSLLMTCSVLTINTFAEDEMTLDDSENTELVDELSEEGSLDFFGKAEEVEDSLKDAAKEEVSAALKDIINGDFSDAKDEIIAAANELLAKDAVEVAEIIVDKKLDAIAKDAGFAEKAEEKAQESLDIADEALGVILDPTTIKEEVVKEQVDIIYDAALEASEAENKAYWAYIEAEKDYNVMALGTEAALAAGLIDAKEAAERTEQAKVNLENVKENAELAAVEAQAKYEEAVVEVETAKTELNDAAKELAEAAGKVLSDTAVITVSEGVVIAADAAIAITQSAINNLEKNISNDLQVLETQHNLSNLINEIDNTLLNDTLDRKDNDGKNSVKKLQETRDKLVQAQNALDKAIKLNNIANYVSKGDWAFDNATTVIGEYIAYETSLNNYLASNESAADVITIAKYVLENVSTISGDKIQVLENGLVVVTNADNSVEFFTIEKEGDIVKLQNQVYNVGLLGEQKVYLNNDKFYYYVGLIPVQVDMDKLNPNDKTYDLNSKLETAKTDLKTANANLNISELNYINNLYDAQKTVDNFADRYKNVNEFLNNNDVKDLVEEMNQLDKELNGGFIDKLLRIGLTNEAVMEAIKDPTKLNTAITKGGEDVLDLVDEYGFIKNVFGVPTPDFNNIIKAFGSGSNETGMLISLINQINNAVNGNDVDAQQMIKDIAQLATSNIVSERTKNAFAELIRNTAKEVRNDAIDQLKTDSKIAAEATADVAKATTNVVVKEAALADKSVKLALANASQKEAEDLYNKAVEADKAADEALAKYWDLMLHPEFDKSGVERAKTAWLNACEIANLAWKDYNAAKIIYDNVYVNNDNLGSSNGEVLFEGQDPNARYDIIAKPLSDVLISKYANALNVNLSNGRTFLIEVFVAENGIKYSEDAMELNNVIYFKVQVPDSLRNAPYLPGTNARVYDVSRWHDYNNDKEVQSDELELVATGLRPNENGELLIPSDKFSIFIITARDYATNYSYTTVDNSTYKAVVKTSNK